MNDGDDDDDDDMCYCSFRHCIWLIEITSLEPFKVRRVGKISLHFTLNDIRLRICIHRMQSPSAYLKIRIRRSKNVLHSISIGLFECADVFRFHHTMADTMDAHLLQFASSLTTHSFIMHLECIIKNSWNFPDFPAGIPFYMHLGHLHAFFVCDARLNTDAPTNSRNSIWCSFRTN